MSTLKASGLKKSFKGREVLQAVDMEVSSGEVVGLLGPNGAGKTTAFYMIVGLIKSDAGTITLDDTDITLHADDNEVFDNATVAVAKGALGATADSTNIIITDTMNP